MTTTTTPSSGDDQQCTLVVSLPPFPSSRQQHPHTSSSIHDDHGAPTHPMPAPRGTEAMVQRTPSCVLCRCLCSPHPWPSLPACTPQVYPLQVWVQVPNLVPVTKPVPAPQIQTHHGYGYGSVSSTWGYTHGIPYLLVTSEAKSFSHAASMISWRELFQADGIHFHGIRVSGGMQVGEGGEGQTMSFLES